MAELFVFGRTVDLPGSTAIAEAEKLTAVRVGISPPCQGLWGMESTQKFD